jgi:hypothetical protein
MRLFYVAVAMALTMVETKVTICFFHPSLDDRLSERPTGLFAGCHNL